MKRGPAIWCLSAEHLRPKRLGCGQWPGADVSIAKTAARPPSLDGVAGGVGTAVRLPTPCRSRSSSDSSARSGRWSAVLSGLVGLRGGRGGNDRSIFTPVPLGVARVPNARSPAPWCQCRSPPAVGQVLRERDSRDHRPAGRRPALHIHPSGSGDGEFTGARTTSGALASPPHCG